MDRARHSLCPVGLLDSPLFPSKIVNLFPLPPKHIYSFPAFLLSSLPSAMLVTALPIFFQVRYYSPPRSQTLSPPRKSAETDEASSAPPLTLRETIQTAPFASHRALCISFFSPFLIRRLKLTNRLYGLAQRWHSAVRLSRYSPYLTPYEISLLSQAFLWLPFSVVILVYANPSGPGYFCFCRDDNHAGCGTKNHDPITCGSRCPQVQQLLSSEQSPAGTECLQHSATGRGHATGVAQAAAQHSG